jgi:hypothetical protein
MIDKYIDAAELADDFGLAPQDVRRRCPWAVEYAGLDGSPTWHRADLEPLFAEEGGELP